MTAHMSKARALRAIRSLDKKQLYEIIAQVPDRVIAEQFQEQLRRNDDRPSVPLSEKIARMWQEAQAALAKGAPSKHK